MILCDSVPQRWSALALVCTILNEAMRADSTKQKILLDDSLLHGPREITEGKAAQYLMDQTGLDLTTIKRVYAGDMAGRQWSTKLEG